MNDEGALSHFKVLLSVKDRFCLIPKVIIMFVYKKNTLPFKKLILSAAGIILPISFLFSTVYGADTLRQWMKENKEGDVQVILERVISRNGFLNGESSEHSQKLVWDYLNQKIDEKTSSGIKDSSLAMILLWKIKMIRSENFQLTSLPPEDLIALVTLAKELEQIESIPHDERVKLKRNREILEGMIPSRLPARQMSEAGPISAPALPALADAMPLYDAHHAQRSGGAAAAADQAQEDEDASASSVPKRLRGDLEEEAQLQAAIKASRQEYDAHYAQRSGGAAAEPAPMDEEQPQLVSSDDDEDGIVRSRKKVMRRRILSDSSADEVVQEEVLMPPSAVKAVSVGSRVLANAQTGRRGLSTHPSLTSAFQHQDRAMASAPMRRRGDLEEEAQLQAAIKASRQEYDAHHAQRSGGAAAAADQDQEDEGASAISAALSQRTKPERRKREETSDEESDDDFSLVFNSEEEGEDSPEPHSDEAARGEDHHSDEEDVRSDYSLDLDEPEEAPSFLRGGNSTISLEDGDRIIALYQAQPIKNMNNIVRAMDNKYTRGVIGYYLKSKGFHKPIKERHKKRKWTAQEKLDLKKAYKREKPKSIRNFAEEFAEKHNRKGPAVLSFINNHKKRRVNEGRPAPTRRVTAIQRWTQEEIKKIKELTEREFAHLGENLQVVAFARKMHHYFPTRSEGSIIKKVFDFLPEHMKKIQKKFGPKELEKLKNFIIEERRANGDAFNQSALARRMGSHFPDRSQKVLSNKIRSILKELREEE